jgi:hypothetical protein
VLLAVEIGPIGMGVAVGIGAFAFCRWGWWRLHETRADGSLRTGEVVTTGDWVQRWVPTAVLGAFALAVVVAGLLN